jgi:cellulose 1,4-beta-cellobiosidase
MFRSALLTTFALLAIANAQGVGTYQTETHPSITVQQCSAGGSCTTKQASVVLDANWRWVHVKGDYTNCYTGAEWNSTVCGNDPKACAEVRTIILYHSLTLTLFPAQQCQLEGAEYSSTYGITTSGDALTLKFIQQNANGKNIGSRVYLMDTDSKYQMFNLLNQEFTFDVDMSQLPCGLNGAVYFVEMDSDGGLAKYPSNTAGAKYGTGYCDTQCPHDMKFINGEVC